MSSDITALQSEHPATFTTVTPVGFSFPTGLILRPHHPRAGLSALIYCMFLWLFGGSLLRPLNPFQRSLAVWIVKPLVLPPPWHEVYSAVDSKHISPSYALNPPGTVLWCCMHLWRGFVLVSIASYPLWPFFVCFYYWASARGVLFWKLTRHHVWLPAGLMF